MPRSHLINRIVSRAQRLQNMPVLGTDSKSLGVLDIRDALKVLFEQEEYQEQMLFNYVAGVGYQ
jgi:hypothetical protein